MGPTPRCTSSVCILLHSTYCIAIAFAFDGMVNLEPGTWMVTEIRGLKKKRKEAFDGGLTACLESNLFPFRLRLQWNPFSGADGSRC